MNKREREEYLKERYKSVIDLYWKGFSDSLKDYKNDTDEFWGILTPRMYSRLSTQIDLLGDYGISEDVIGNYVELLPSYESINKWAESENNEIEFNSMHFGIYSEQSLIELVEEGSDEEDEFLSVRFQDLFTWVNRIEKLKYLNSTLK